MKTVGTFPEGQLTIKDKKDPDRQKNYQCS